MSHLQSIFNGGSRQTSMHRQLRDKDAAIHGGRVDSIYQRLVNRLARDAPLEWAEEREKEWGSQWPSRMWRWRPQNENQELQFIAGTANFPDFTPSSPSAASSGRHYHYTTGIPAQRATAPVAGYTPRTDKRARARAGLTFLHPEIPTVIGKRTVHLTVATGWRI